tara:strand:+ start:7615 stop:8796 length:1182 start_codon:yes stop_codon:yes gene_type:complete
MALQVRRGTNAERLGITPALGELIFTTDSKRLYVGDGSTVGGLASAGLESLIADTTPQLGGNLDLNGQNITGTGNISIDGSITATGTINLGDDPADNVSILGSLTTSLTPVTDSSSDIGSTSKRWRNGYFAGLTVDGQLNVVAINSDLIADDSTLVFDASTGLVAAEQLTGTLPAGVIPAAMTSNITGNVTGNLTGNADGAHTGTFVGDVTGSVFSDDSIVLVDGVNSNIVGPVVGKVSTGETIDVTLDQTLDGNDGLVLNMHRGTDAVKLEPNNNDRSFVKWASWNGTAFADNALIGGYHKTGGGGYLAITPAEADGTVFTTAIEMDGVDGTILINTTDKVTSNAPIESTKYLRVGSYATGALPGTAAGTIAFDSTTNTFKGYNGSAWVELG